MPMSDYWDKRAEAWSKRVDTNASQADPYREANLEALAAKPGEHILDIGCGPALTSIAIARSVGPTGAVTAVDISEGMLTDAKRRINADNSVRGPIELRHGDAERIDLGKELDAAHSRFGVMFFNDPDQAFTGIAAALRSGGRIAWLIWGTRKENPWTYVPNEAAAEVLGVTQNPWSGDGPGPHSLGNPDKLTAQLADAGFTEIEHARHDQPRVLRADNPAADLATMMSVGPLSTALATADLSVHNAAIDAALDTLESYRSSDGYQIPAVAYVVTATKI